VTGDRSSDLSLSSCLHIALFTLPPSGLVPVTRTSSRLIKSATSPTTLIQAAMASEKEEKKNQTEQLYVRGYAHVAIAPNWACLGRKGDEVGDTVRCETKTL
jgi:hypothetical protein